MEYVSTKMKHDHFCMYDVKNWRTVVQWLLLVYKKEDKIWAKHKNEKRQICCSKSE